MTLMNSAVGIANGGKSVLPGSSVELAPSSGGRSSASSASDARPLCAAADGSELSIELPAYGVRATFSPRSLEVLQQAAHSVASEAGDLIEQIGDSAVEIIETAQTLVQDVAEGISESAQALMAGGEAAQSGVQQLAREAETLVSQGLSKAGDAAGAALGYGAVATLAGQALLSAMA